MLEIVFIAPLITGVIAFFLKGTAARPLLVFTAAVHLLISLLIWRFRPAAAFADFFMITPEGLVSRMVISLLFCMIAIYTMGYLKKSTIRSEPVFIGCLLLFLATMTMVTLSDHIMVMWIAIEATTLASAPLIYTHRSAASLEATWKYVLICSVGIALALLGSVLIALAMDLGGVNVALSFSGLTAVADKLNPFWLKTGFVFILVGYGTKMGLAPMHTWLPDAHSEAPSPVSALLSGVLLNCAYLGIFKTNKLMQAAGLGDFSGTVLIIFGLASILAAATYILKQTEYKRMLAYSSIENMGIIAFGTGIGGVGAYGALLCLLHHSLIKSALFLSSGNILLGYGSRLIEGTGKLVKHLPRTFLAFFGGFTGICGLPPFGLFLGELLIVMGAFRSHHYAAVSLFLASICVIIAGLANHVMKISFGGGGVSTQFSEDAAMVWPQYTLLLTSVVLCFWMPAAVSRTIMEAVNSLGGGF
jgi:hydrogenase-4 component F